MKIKLLTNTARIPRYETAEAAGMDLRVDSTSPINISPGDTLMLSTGVAIHIDNPGIAAMILPRSSLGHKHGIVLGNLVGLIDSDYQGELKISCWNRSDKEYTIAPGERIAQIVFTNVISPEFQLVESFEETARGEGGFGSTQ